MREVWLFVLNGLHLAIVILISLIVEVLKSTRYIFFKQAVLNITW